jgi:hypothetical protein
MTQREMWYRIDLDRDASCSMIASRVDWGDFDWRRLNRLGRIDAWPADATAHVAFVVEEGSSERATDYLDIPSVTIPAISGRARRAIESVVGPTRVQFLPIELFAKADLRTLGNYWVVNVLDSVAGLSFERTKWIGKPSTAGQINARDNILRAVIAGRIVHGHDLFRLDVNGLPFRLFASERLRDAIADADSADGFEFEPVLVV